MALEALLLSAHPRPNCARNPGPLDGDAGRPATPTQLANLHRQLGSSRGWQRGREFQVLLICVPQRQVTAPSPSVRGQRGRQLVQNRAERGPRAGPQGPKRSSRCGPREEEAAREGGSRCERVARVPAV